VRDSLHDVDMLMRDDSWLLVQAAAINDDERKGDEHHMVEPMAQLSFG